VVDKQLFSTAMRWAIYEEKNTKELNMTMEKASQWLSILKTGHNYHIVRQILLASQKFTDNFYELSIEIYEQQYSFHINDGCFDGKEEIES
jgi:hypothetical protein